MAQDIAIVVPTRGRPSNVVACLESLYYQSLPREEYEIIVVQDGVVPTTEKDYARIRSETRVETRWVVQEHKGPAAARNQGADVSRGEILAFIDDDCIADRNWLRRLTAAVDGNAGAEGRVEPLGKPNPLTHQVTNHGGQYLTANVAYQRDWFLKVGGFDESFPFPASEDYEIAWRVIEAGGSIAYADDALVFHPVRYESFSDFARRLRAWDAPYHLARKHPVRFREFTGRGPTMNSLYYTLFNPAYLFFRWRRELVHELSYLLPFTLRMTYQFLYGATQTLRRVHNRYSEADSPFRPGFS